MKIVANILCGLAVMACLGAANAESEAKVGQSSPPGDEKNTAPKEANSLLPNDKLPPNVRTSATFPNRTMDPSSASPTTASPASPALAPDSRVVGEVAEESPDVSTAPSSPVRKPSGVLSKVKQKLSFGRTSSPAKRRYSSPPMAEMPQPDEQAPTSPEKSIVPSASQPMVQSGDYPVLQQTLAKYKVTPASVGKPSDVCQVLATSSDRIRSAVSARNYSAIEQETVAIRSQTCGLRSLSSLSLEQRLKVSSICRMVDDGIEMIEEGRQTGDESKIHLGLEKIREASELLKPLTTE